MGVDAGRPIREAPTDGADDSFAIAHVEDQQSPVQRITMSLALVIKTGLVGGSAGILEDLIPEVLHRMDFSRGPCDFGDQSDRSG